MSNHVLERTSPKGGPSLSRCVKCGETNLKPFDATKPCSAGGSMEGDLVIAIEGDGEPLGIPLSEFSDVERLREIARYYYSLVDDLAGIDGVDKMSRAECKNQGGLVSNGYSLFVTSED